MKKSFVKSMTVWLVLTLVLSLFAIPGTGLAAGAIATDNGGKKSTVNSGAGQSIGFQFKITESFTQAGIEIAAKSSKKVIVAALYKWDQSALTSVKGTPLAVKEYTEWARGDILSVDGSFEPGEYYFNLLILDGGSIKFTWFATPANGVQGYQNEYLVKGAPVGQIVSASGSPSALAAVSAQTGETHVKAPAESVISPDSMIAQMNVNSDLWAGVDGLGRTLPNVQETGEKKDKKVGIFYWTWHTENTNCRPVNVTNILKEHPDAVRDYKHPIWKENNVPSYYWDEPLWGYYTEEDDYVLRKHAELLADAGVDFVVFDCTNGNATWESAYTNLLRVWDQARKDGVKTPQIAFMMPFWDKENTNDSLHQIYNRIYRAGLYQDLWFYWEGKPLVMALKSSLSSKDEIEADMLDFFTFRRGEPDYWQGDQDDSNWGWLHVYPQALYKNSDGTVEMTTVGVAQNANYVTRTLSAMNSGKNMGRGYSGNKDFQYTYQYRGQEIVCNSKMENAYLYGINFQEQWDFAIAADPELIFVTGWNEWIAGRYETWCGVSNAFPDQGDAENSRDCEPSKGILKDYFYYQLVANIRRFKGMTAPAKDNIRKTVDITAGTDAWQDSKILTYNTYKNNTYERKIKSRGNTYTYENPGIRNDIVTSKVTYDENNLYFYVETAEALTPSTDANWMRLLLDTQAATADSADWEEFEYLLNRESPNGDTMTLERSKGGWNWEKVGEARFTVSGSILQVELPRALLGLPEGDFEIRFKWADANLTDGDIMTLYTDGDAAPGGRFTYVFDSKSFVAEGEEPADGPQDNPGKKAGCGNMISGISAALALLSAGAFLSFRKKEH